MLFHSVCVDKSWKNFERTGSCYKLVESYQTFSSAVQHCRRLKSQLVEIFYHDENEFVAKLNRGRDLWIGLKFQLSDHLSEKGKSVWMWDTSKVQENRSAFFTNWAAGKPNRKGTSDNADCVLINNEKNLGKWDNRKCDERKYFVCEKDSELNDLVYRLHDVAA